MVVVRKPLVVAVEVESDGNGATQIIIDKFGTGISLDVEAESGGFLLLVQERDPE